jgi:penicillin amidase/acyl-homoserine-lactone acylase
MVWRSIVGVVLFAFLASYSFFLAHEARLGWFDAKAALTQAAKYDATIVRDRYGVPHITGRRDADAAFGLAYAHAEDDFATIERTILAARGRLATVDGVRAAEGDYLVQLLGIWDVLDERYETDLSADTRALLDGYAAGLNLYAGQHKSAVLPGFAPARGQDLAALFMVRLPFLYGLDEQLRALLAGATNEIAPPAAKLPQGVGIAIAPSRSGDGSTRLLINPQGPFSGPLTWYEAVVNSGEGWTMAGGLMPGSPVFLAGAGPQRGWAFSTNHPDLIDVYQLEANPNDRYFYRFDGEWQRLETKDARIVVRFWSPIRWTFRREILRSVHGPVIRNSNGLFAVHYAGQDDLKGVEAFYRLNKSKDYDSFSAALSTHDIPSLNFVYAERNGRIAEIYNGAFPDRAAGYEWTHAVPGNLSATLWDQYLPFEAVPKVVAPGSGFVVAANQTPFRVTADGYDPMPDAFAAGMGIETGMSNRARRALALLSPARAVNAAAFKAMKFDNCYAPDSDFAQIVKEMAAKNYAGDPLLEEAGENLRRYNLCTDVQNRGAALAVILTTPLLNASANGQVRPEPVAILKNAANRLLRSFGRIDPTWGEINRLRRDAIDLPVNGAPDTLRNIMFERQGRDGTSSAPGGDALTMFSTWSRDGRWEVESVLPFGQSAVPGAPHATDQAQLFAEQKLKIVPLNDAALRAEMTSVERPGRPSPGFRTTPPPISIVPPVAPAAGKNARAGAGQERRSD